MNTEDLIQLLLKVGDAMKNPDRHTWDDWQDLADDCNDAAAFIQGTNLVLQARETPQQAVRAPFGAS